MSYFGSVKFFKHIIISVAFLILIFPYSVLIYIILGSNIDQKQVYNTSESINSTTQDMLSFNAYKILHANQMSKEVLSILPSKDIISYQQKYKDLYVERKNFSNVVSNEKIAYLTFDDGPSNITLDILDILDNYKIKATFFVIYKDDDLSLKVYKEIVNRGHTLAVHSASHIYKDIYNSVDDYLDDFYKMFMHIYEVTGVKPNLFRFPGGSINSYNVNIYQELISEMLRRGFVYYDWNVTSGDAVKGATKEDIVKSVSNGLREYNKIIVLMHDSATKKNTSESLPKIIENLQNEGFRFDKLDGTVSPIEFGYSE